MLIPQVFCSHSNFDRPKGNLTFTWGLDTSKTQVWYCTAKLKLTPSVWSGIFTRLFNCTFSSGSVPFDPRRRHSIGNIPLIIAHWHSETQKIENQARKGSLQWPSGDSMSVLPCWLHVWMFYWWYWSSFRVSLHGAVLNDFFPQDERLSYPFFGSEGSRYFKVWDYWTITWGDSGLEDILNVFDTFK